MHFHHFLAPFTSSHSSVSHSHQIPSFQQVPLLLLCCAGGLPLSLIRAVCVWETSRAALFYQVVF